MKSCCKKEVKKVKEGLEKIMGSFMTSQKYWSVSKDHLVRFWKDVLKE